MKSKKILVILISILLLVLLVGSYFSFAYYAVNNTPTNNLVLNVSIASGESANFTVSRGSNVTMQVLTANMMNQTGGTVAGTTSTTLTVNLTSPNDIDCDYDLVWEWVSGTSAYTKTSGATKEFTVAGTTGSLTLNETQVSNSTTALTLGTYTISTNNSTTSQKWTFTSKFYNLNINQDAHAGKNLKGRIKVANVDCNKIPNTYQQVEYIQNSGTQYIDTGYYWQHENIEIYFDGLQPTTTSSKSLFGAEEYTAASGNARSFSGIPHGGSNGSYGIYLGDGNKYTLATPLATRFNMRIVTTAAKNLKVYLNGVQKTSVTYTGTVMSKANAYLTSTTSNNVGHIFLFSNHNSNRGSTTTGTQIMHSLQVYSFKLIDNGVLVRDFVPVYRKSDGVIGMFDTVERKFYTNAGTGTFTKGSDVK